MPWTPAETVAADLLRPFDRVHILAQVVRQLGDDDGRRLAELVDRVYNATFTDEDLDALSARSLGSPGMPASMDDDMLASASILSLRNQTRMAMEPAQVLRWARRAGRVVYRWRSIDTACSARDQRNNLPRVSYYFEGMRVAIADRISPRYCLVKNNDAVLTGIVFDGPVPVATSCIVDLERMPLGVYVRVNGWRGEVCAGRPDQLYLRPIASTGASVRRRNLPYVPLCTATDFFLQGGTIRPPDTLVMDLRRPDTGCMERASVIVGVTRVEAWSQTILLAPLWRTPEERAVRLPALRHLLMPSVDLALFTYDMEARAGIRHAESRDVFIARYRAAWAATQAASNRARQRAREAALRERDAQLSVLPPALAPAPPRTRGRPRGPGAPIANRGRSARR